MRVKRQFAAEDSDYHYGPNHNAPHFVLFNGDFDVDGGGIAIELPDIGLPDVNVPLPGILGIFGGRK